MERAKILCVCGTGIATSTVVHNGVKNIMEKYNIPYDVVQCKALEVASKLSSFKPTVIVSTTPISIKTNIPIISGIPFLSGVGIDQVEQQLIDIVKK